MNKIKFLLPLILILFGVFICVILITCKPTAEPEPVKFLPPIIELQKARSNSLNVIVKSQGFVSPRTESKLFPEMSGQVTFVSPKLDKGSSFNKGDILVKIDSKDYELDIKNAESALTVAKTRLLFEEAESKSAKEEWRKLGKGEATDLVLRIPQLKQAKSAVEAAEANLLRLKRNLAKTDVRAPYDGLVRQKNVDIGTVVAPGYLLASIYAIDYVEVKLPISDEELAFIDIPLDGSEINNNDQPIVSLIGSFGGTEIVWSGVIVRMEAEIDPRSRMATLIARIAEPYNKKINKTPLRVGQFVEAKIIGRRYNKIFKIHRDLIQENNLLPIVSLKDSTINFKEISILRYIDNDSVLINDGIKENDLICTTDLTIMIDKMKVQIK